MPTENKDTNDQQPSSNEAMVLTPTRANFKLALIAHRTQTNWHNEHILCTTVMPMTHTTVA